MAIQTVNELAVEMTMEVGESASNTSYISKVEKWIQECVDRIGIAKRWDYLYSIASLNTVAGTRTYNLTATFEQELAARFTSDSGVLGFLEKENLVNAGRILEDQGRPNTWYIDAYDISNEKLTIGLYYVPDAVYTLEFLGKLVPQELSSSSKLPFPRSFIHVLKDGIRAKIFRDDGNYAGANTLEQLFRSGIRELVGVKLITAKMSRLGRSDLSSSKPDLVRLDPNHFRNKW